MSRPRHLCLLDNDHLDPAVVDAYVSYGAMTERMFEAAGVDWRFDRFDTTRGEYPADFDRFDAVLLTGSRADSFSDEPWVRALREKVGALLAARKTLLGVCFGHQVIAHCLGAPVGRAPQGWGVGRMRYDWVGPLPFEREGADASATIALLASHQDQVLALPEGATLLATSEFCPVAAYRIDDRVLCVQPHPEFVPAYSAYLLDKRRALFGEERHAAAAASLALGHDGLHVARFMRDFVEARARRLEPVLRGQRAQQHPQGRIRVAAAQGEDDVLRVAEERRPHAAQRSERRDARHVVVGQEGRMAAGEGEQRRGLDAVRPRQAAFGEGAQGRVQVDRERVDDAAEPRELPGRDICVGTLEPGMPGRDPQAVRLGVEPRLLQPGGRRMGGEHARVELAGQDAALDLDRPQRHQLQREAGQRVDAGGDGRRQAARATRGRRGEQGVDQAQPQHRPVDPREPGDVVAEGLYRVQQAQRDAVQRVTRGRQREAAAATPGEGRADARLELAELTADRGQVGLKLRRRGREPACRDHHAEQAQLAQLGVADGRDPARGVAGEQGGGLK